MTRTLRLLPLFALILALVSSAAQALPMPGPGSPLPLTHSFGPLWDDGLQPMGALTPDGTTLYGVTMYGGLGDGPVGTVYKVETDGSGYTVLHRFSGQDGMIALAPPVLSGSTLYGVTAYGGAFGNGVLYKVNTDGSGFDIVRHFQGGAGAAGPSGCELILVGGTLYGTTWWSGSHEAGVVYKIDTDGNNFQVLHEFDPGAGEGEDPESGLTLVGGTLYGTTWGGGAGEYGTVFKVNPDGSGFDTIHEFSGNDGRYPWGGLTPDGSTLYGTTMIGGADGEGVVFKINTDSSGFSVLHHFDFSQGSAPGPGNLALSGTTLYGTTMDGGTFSKGEGYGGVLYKLKTDGSGFSVLHNFGDGVTDAYRPMGPPIMLDGTLYGTSTEGGANGFGTIYEYALILKGDINGDGVVNRADLLLLKRMMSWKHFQNPPPFHLSGDLNGDGKVNNVDLRILTTCSNRPDCLLKHYGARGETPGPLPFQDGWAALADGGEFGPGLKEDFAGQRAKLSKSAGYFLIPAPKSESLYFCYL